jgi:hypothetical protein
MAASSRPVFMNSHEVADHPRHQCFLIASLFGASSGKPNIILIIAGTAAKPGVRLRRLRRKSIPQESP